MATNTNYTDSNDKPHRLMDTFSYVVGQDGLNVASTSNPIPTTATITGDVNVDSTSIAVQSYIGKPSGSNADFTTARTGATTFTCSSLPTGVSQINQEDIETIRQINSSGEVVETYSRDDADITCSGTDPTTVTVAGASFGATDTILIYTNIYKPIETDVQIGAVELKDADSATRVDIESDSSKNAIYTQSESLAQESTLSTIETNTDYGTVVGGGAEASALRVTLANDSTGIIKISDGTDSLEIIDNGDTWEPGTTDLTGIGVYGYDSTNNEAKPLKLNSSGEIIIDDAVLSDNSQTTQIVDSGGNAVTVTDNKLEVISKPAWTDNHPANGTLGAAVDSYPGASCTVYEIIVNAPLAADDATLVINADGSPIFNGYLAQRDGDNAIKFPSGETAASSLTVTVSGSTDDVYVLVRYK